MRQFKYKYRNCDDIIDESVIGFGFIKFLYSCKIAYPLLKIITGNQLVSCLVGSLMNTKLSRLFISKFVKKHNINMVEIEKNIAEFKHFNDFFYRKLKPLSRTIEYALDTIISPADGKILVYEDANEIIVKDSIFDIDKLLKNRVLSSKYKNCSIAVVRLAPTDYHRFHFPCDGYVTQTRLINGKYYSVSPISLRFEPKIFIENKRTLCEITNEQLGSFIYMEVGATLVGSIKQTYTPNSHVKKGDEKGYFRFGGSTVILIFPQEKVVFDNDLVRNSENFYETKIAFGESIGRIRQSAYHS